MNKTFSFPLDYFNSMELKLISKKRLADRSALEQLAVEQLAVRRFFWNRALRECETEGRMFCFLN